MRSLSRTAGRCDSTGTPCVSVHFSYPAVARVASVPGIDSVIAYINDQMFASLEDAALVQSFDSIASGLVEQHTDLTEEFADYRLPWTLERSCRVLLDTAGLISIRFEESSFLGGVHGLQIVRLASFDASSGRRLTYDGLFRPGHEAEFARVVEKGLREARSIPDSQSLANAGFWVEEGKFPVTPNFAVVPGEIVVYYVPYEIGPYAVGPTEVRVPIRSVRNLLLPDGVVQ
jgi:hypothetical protein